MRLDPYLENLATNLLGKKTLEALREKRREKNIKPYTVRASFDYMVKVFVSTLSSSTLGRICSMGEHLGNDGMIVTSGTNPWSAMYLSTADSGLTLIQKIATATLLSAIYHLINEGQPEIGDQWMPMELVGVYSLSEMEGRRMHLEAILHWES